MSALRPTFRLGGLTFGQPCDIFDRWKFVHRRDQNGFRYERLVWDMPLKKPSVGSASSCGTLPSECLGDWAQKYPLVCEFLLSATWDDGSLRVPGLLRLSTRDGKLTVMLKCEDSHRVAFISATSLKEALQLAQKGLETDRLDWREDKYEKGRPSTKGGR